MFYWRQLAKQHKVAVAQDNASLKVDFKGSLIKTGTGVPQDSPDVLVIGGETTQSENSVFVHPNNNDSILNSNNSSDYPAQMMFGADGFVSEDAGTSWDGSIYGAGEDNGGDPAAAISMNGTMYVGKINAFYGQSVAHSNDGGLTWDDVVLASVTGYPNLLDKNHLWVDNSPSSLFRGNVYSAWTRFGGTDDGQIQLSRSVNNGLAWSVPVSISNGANALKHNQGVNVQTGPNGEVYAVWAIYDNWPADENALGFARSFDGGQTFDQAYRIIFNINGLRNSLTTKNMRVSGFPAMSVDLSNGPNRGSIYVVWNNLGFPGINSGPDVDVYMIKSTDLGSSWSTPLKVNQDLSGIGKQHFMPWITCDAVTGTLSVIFFDDRNVGTDQCEIYVANSYDGGQNWEDFRVSDFAFTPAPIPGLAGGYFGDYLGISANDRKVYPVWSDNRSGKTLAYVSPFETGPPPNQPYVIYENVDITPADASLQQTLSNGDSVHFTISMQNIGDEDAQNVMVRLSTSSPYIVITDSLEPYGNFLTGQSVTKEEGFTLKVSDTIPDGIKVRFDLKATDGDSTWNSHFQCDVMAPQLEILTYSINDFTGNNNRILDPGETAEIRLIIRNSGDYPLGEVLNILTTSTSELIILEDSSVLPQLVSNQTDTAFFQVSLAGNTPYGINLLFRFRAISGLHHVSKNFFSRVGLIVEDWETNTFTKYPWMRSGNSLFSLTPALPYEGVWSASSGDIDDEEESVLKLTYDIASDDSVTFWYKTSTESNYDQLEFYVDNIRKGKWSGIRDWKRVGYMVPAGNHTLRWQYSKDSYFSAGVDKIWLDYISLPVFNLPVVEAGGDTGICSGQDSIHLNAMAQNYSSIQWSTTGDGVFNQQSSPETDYFPGAQDIANGFVTLKIKAITNMAIAMDSLILYIQNPPLSPQNLTVSTQVYCLGAVNQIILSADSVSVDSIYWYTGSCNGAIIGQSYAQPVQAPVTNTVFYAVKANACGFSQCDSVTVNVNPLPVVELGPDTSICTLQTIILDAGPDQVMYTWNTGSTGRFLEIDSLTVPVGESRWFKVVVGNEFGCEATDSVRIMMTHCPGWGILDNAKAQEFSIYPNPAHDEIFLKYKTALNSDVIVELFDESGKLVTAKVLAQGSVNIRFLLNKLAAGTYYLKTKHQIMKLIIN